MKPVLPEPFFFEAGPRAVLLLHGFTGNSADVRMLGRFLEKHGYTSLAPHYKGHGVPPEELIHTNPQQWWQSVIDGYQKLQDAGYKEIAVAGLSLGGVFSLKLGYSYPVKGIITMCAPMTMRTTELMFEGVVQYAERFNQHFGKSEEESVASIEYIKKHGMPSLQQLRDLVYEVREHVDEIYAPIFVVQGRKDEVIDIKSANYIYEQAESNEKQIKWYEKSGHVITLDQERKQLDEDIFQFLESLDWHE
ncbi:alpha/beta hydrolase [Rummeliibacillus pycnus]|uniref:alpha/beta hydrolase n=1 Tax=Rummeliibacillus pycnus TaxID=101070 RepID=UPI003D2B64A3